MDSSQLTDPEGMDSSQLRDPEFEAVKAKRSVGSRAVIAVRFFQGVGELIRSINAFHYTRIYLYYKGRTKSQVHHLDEMD